MPFTITPEPVQTAPATELVAVGAAWGALDTHGPWHGKRSIGVLTAVTALHCSHTPRTEQKVINGAICVLMTT